MTSSCCRNLHEKLTILSRSTAYNVCVMQESEEGKDAESSAENIIVHSILLTVLCAPHTQFTHAARTQRNLLSSVGRRDHIMGIALKGLLE